MKTKIIVDTNIVFSAILKPSGNIGKILIFPKRQVQFYSCDFLKTELLKHRLKLLDLSKLTAEKLDEVELLLTKNIIFINEGLLPAEIVFPTKEILADVDVHDTPFVALTKYLQGKLWTGDKVLIRGLERNGSFVETLTTTQVYSILDDLKN